MSTLLLALLLACKPTAPTTPAAAPEPPTEAVEVATAPPAEAEPADAEPAEDPAEAEPAEEPTEAEPTEPPEPATDPRPRTGDKAGGDSCLAGDECLSGICEGEGCGDANPGTCAPEMRACTRDLRPYCGCDGVTFRSGGNCPMQRFEHRGECEAPE